ncbi:MAG: hypothetical protein [Circular genetic element sp.]|nr:MAG: hypothetical protein [Circular genetic element sp.]
MSNIYYDTYATFFESIELHVGMRSPKGLPNFGPKPLVSPYGSGYAMHPELSRSGAAYLASRMMGPTAYVLAPIVLYDINRLAIESAPQEKQRGLWMMFASAIGGTFGGDYSGLV